MIEMSEEQLSSQSRDAMLQHDRMMHSAGMNIVSVSPGEAVVSMVVREEMLNGFSSCHGGMIFSLADTAFAYACNSRNEMNVALDCRIDFLRPGFENDELTAYAFETYLGRSGGLYKVTVKNQHGKVVAEFTGRSHNLKKPVVKDENKSL